MPTIRRPDAPRVPLHLQHMVRRRAVCSTLIATVLVTLLASCFRPESSQAVTITELRAATSTSVLVVLDQPLIAVGDPLSMFDIKAAGGGRLAVVAVHPDATNTRFTLATVPQEQSTYTLTVGAGNLAPSGGTPTFTSRDFTGSDVPAPLVIGAVAISNTEVVIRLFDPVAGEAASPGGSALDTNEFQVIASTGEALTVEGVALDDAGAMLLTTSPQEDDTYAVTLGGVYAEPGGRLVDPFNNSAGFLGIARNDGAAPALIHAESRGPSSVLLRFSEPIAQGPGGVDDPAAYQILGSEAEELGVSKAQAGNHATEVVLTTVRHQVNGEEYTVTVTGLEDLAGNRVAPAARSATFLGNTTPGEADTTPPRLSNVASTRNNAVVVTFSEPVAGGPGSAENPSHYRVYAAPTGEVTTQATLQIVRAELDARRTSVTLTTGSQSDLTYTLEVVNVRDLAGNQMAPPERDLLPSVMTFRGTPPSPGELIDSDGDGLTDDVEQRGWTVTIRLLDGSTQRRDVSSDPFEPDTDGDGILDADERAYGTDPRNADTDGDGLTDWDELNRFYSDPANQDSDADGLTDGLEATFFFTSPLLADTDGDQLSDDYEVGADNRNPRIADLPRVDIRVGVVDLRLDVRFEETTSRGSRTLDSRSAATTLVQSQESAQARETSSALEWFVKGGAEVCIKGGCEDAEVAGAKFTVEGGASGSTSTTFSTASVNATQREYATSLTTDAEVSAESVVTRVVEGATMAVEVTLANASNISFTISDIEITALLQDPHDPSVLVPVATLQSATGASISIGPLTPERGPFRFSTDAAYPSLVESLMANPRGLIFRVANYEITDELGRNFAFVEQDVNDRTAFFEINYAGNLPMERYQVATNNVFDEYGYPQGVTMAQVLEQILGLEYVSAARDDALNPNVRADADLLDRSYSTRTVNGVDTLTRIKRVSAGLTRQDRDWWVIGPQGNITPVGTRPGLDFRAYRIYADQDFALAFVQDLDEDDLEANEEMLYRSIDSLADVDPADGVPDSRDSDRDGVNDADEVYGPFEGNRRVRWIIRPEDGRDAYTTMAHPGRADTDGDGLTDCQELLVSPACSAINVYTDGGGVPTLAPRSSNGVTHAFLTTTHLLNRTDPANPDSDGDGLTDLEEVIGFGYTNLSGVRTVVTPLTDPATRYATNPLARDTDFDGLEDRLEVLLGSNPLSPDGDSVRDEDADGLVNAVETAGQQIRVSGRAGMLNYVTTSDPRLVDTDGDGLTDWEEYFGCRDANRDFRCDSDERFGPTDPRLVDTDGDGLSDRNEVDGVLFQGDSAQPLRRTDPVNWDTDADGRSDGEEMNQSWMVNVAGRGGYVVWSDPLQRDADGDGLSDSVEYEDGTDPNEADTDGDGALDSLERTRPTSPLVPDHLVTVTYLGLQAGKGSSASAADGDPGSNAGDFYFRFEVRVPNSDGSLRLHRVTSSWEVAAPACNGEDDRFCRGSVDGSPVIQIPAPLLFSMNESYQFAVPFTGLFTIEGLAQEVDPGPIADVSYWFGGFADPNGVFSGSDLRKGSFALAFNDSPNPNVPIEVTVFVMVE